MGLLTKAVAICIRKKVSNYYESNNWDDKSLSI